MQESREHPVESTGDAPSSVLQRAPKRSLLNSVPNSSSKRQRGAQSGLTGDEAAGGSSTASPPIPSSSSSGRENTSNSEANLNADEENHLNIQNPHFESAATKLMLLYSGKRTRPSFHQMTDLIKTQILPDAAAADPDLLPGDVATKIISSITRRGI